MQPEAILIVAPAVDFNLLLTISHKALGYSPARAADSSKRNLVDAERYLSVLAAMREPDAQVGFAPHLLCQLTYSLLVLCDERDLLDILEAAAGMSFVSADTIHSGVSVAVISGNLAQWRDVVKAGASMSAASSVRLCFSKILLQFDKHGLSPLWADCTRKQSPDQTGFYLEDKRR